MFKPQNLHVIYKHCNDWDKLIPFRDRTIQEVGFLMSESSNLNLSRMHSSSVLFQTFIMFLTNLKMVLIIYYSYFLIVGLRRESVIDLYNESFLCSLISALFLKKYLLPSFSIGLDLVLLLQFPKWKIRSMVLQPSLRAYVFDPMKLPNTALSVTLKIP